jgi:hypothetical protein
MTYLFGCGDKSFQNVAAACGEYAARGCSCGGSTQNSFAHIKAVFGFADPTPPSVTITEPANNAAVLAGFVVRANVSDDDGINRAELFVDDVLVGTVSTTPYVFNTPADLADGGHEVVVLAYDDFGTQGSDTIFAIVGEPCGGPGDCAGGETCVDGRCVAGPGTPGGLGESCSEGADCASNLCANNSICVEYCEPDQHGCPDGFGCVSAGDDHVCWPGAQDEGGDSDLGGGCCAVAAAERAPWGTLVLVLAVGLASLRGGRRRGRPRT